MCLLIIERNTSKRIAIVVVVGEVENTFATTIENVQYLRFPIQRKPDIK